CENHRWDLVVTLGGDGTLLWSSHMVGPDTPMVAVNSAPGSSVGYFCAGDRNSLRETLSMALTGALKATRLARMEVALDGEVVSTRVLNDILFSHTCPAATSRYIIELGEAREEQLSSGIWAGPAAGSTAAQRSAGGRVLPPGSQKLQFVVREPYFGLREGYSLTKGLVSPGEVLRVRSKMREGRIFMDGAQKMLDVDIGTEIRLRTSDEPLTLLGLRR
ncbi:MAG: NAD(+)/NADH kinase, partial [Polyangiaceae bacterium]|nr:NAD(+)/NADH kinase [Polyangiaceae bacterium]